MGRGGGRARDYVGGGRAKRLFSPSQFHQQGGRVAAVASWVRISCGVGYAVFIALMLQNVGGGREDVGGGGLGGGGDIGVHS